LHHLNRIDCPTYLALIRSNERLVFECDTCTRTLDVYTVPLVNLRPILDFNFSTYFIIYLFYYFTFPLFEFHLVFGMKFTRAPCGINLEGGYYMGDFEVVSAVSDRNPVQW